MKKIINKVLKHRLFFLFAVLFSILYILTYVMDKSYYCVFIFTLLYFGIQKTLIKNIPLSLLFSLLITNIIFGCKKITEGMTGNIDMGQIKSLMSQLENVQKQNVSQNFSAPQQEPTPQKSNNSQEKKLNPKNVNSFNLSSNDLAMATNFAKNNPNMNIDSLKNLGNDLNLLNQNKGSANINMDSFNGLLNLTKSLDISNMKNSGDIEKAATSLRANKEAIIDLINNF